MRLGWRSLSAAAAGWWAIELARLLLPPAPIAPSEWWALWAVATGAQIVAVAAWTRGAWLARRWPGEGEAVALLIAAGSVADGAGPWAWGPAWASARWEVGRWQSAATWAGVCGVAAWHWRTEKKQRAKTTKQA